MQTTYLIFCIIVVLRTSLQLDLFANHFKSPGLSLYNNNAGLNKIIKQLTQQHPQIAKFKQCNEDNNIKYLHIGNKKQADGIIMCNIHPRQLITAQICVNWAKRYVQNIQNLLDSNNKSNQQTLGNLSVNVFYNANLNREAVTQNDTCDRKSISGMDLNRNFPTEFNFYNSTKKSQIYPGTYPISDPFTRCLQTNVQQNKPIFFIDLHSGENGGLFYQQGYNSRQDRLIFQQLNRQICNNTCRVTTLARDGQAINGHIFADLKVRYKMKYSLLLQVYGNEQRENCIQLFNPITSKDKDEVVRKWSDGIDVILREISKRERQ